MYIPLSGGPMQCKWRPPMSGASPGQAQLISDISAPDKKETLRLYTKYFTSIMTP